MADDFEARLYALIAEFEGDGEEHIKRFKDKGDAARIFADLSAEADAEGLSDDLLELMLAFGVPLPSGEEKIPKAKFFAEEVWMLREVTVGELKEAAARGRWPDDTWSYSRKTWWHHARAMIITIVSVPIAAIALPIAVCVMGVKALWRRVLPKSA